MKRLFVVLLMLAVSRPLVAQKPQDSTLPTRSPTYPTPSPQQGDAGITQLLKDCLGELRHNLRHSSSADISPTDRLESAIP